MNGPSIALTPRSKTFLPMLANADQCLFHNLFLGTMVAEEDVRYPTLTYLKALDSRPPAICHACSCPDVDVD